MACQQDQTELVGHWDFFDTVSCSVVIKHFLYFLTTCRSYVGTIVLMTVPNTGPASQGGLLFSYYIVLSFWAAQGLGMSMLSR